MVTLCCAGSAGAQDTIAIAAGAAQSGQTATIPVTIRDVSGTPLGADAPVSRRIQGFAFKVLFPTDLIESMAFARAGEAASRTPSYETSFGGEGWLSYVAAFRADDPLLLPGGAPMPGVQVGSLIVTLRAAAPAGASSPLRLDPASAILTNQDATVHETVAATTLALQNGSVTVASLAAPQNLLASAVAMTRVDLTWTAVANAAQYEVWRRDAAGPYAIVATPASSSFTDFNVVAGEAYFYRVRAVSGSGGVSGFSTADPATLVAFTEDPLAVRAVIRALHVTQLREAVNALRESAGLDALAADPSIRAGASPLAQHVTDLRAAINEARGAAGAATVVYSSDPAITPGVTPIRSAHLQQLRDAVE